MARSIGIDLGSSGSAAAAVDGSGVRLLLDPLGEAILPTAVHFGEGEVCIGEEARIMAPSAPRATVYDFVPLLGRPFAGETCQRARTVMAAPLVSAGAGGIGVQVGDAVHPLTGLAAMVLSALRARADGATAARITVPATAGPGRRRAVKVAARRAGFAEARLISAPLAAAVAHDAGRGGHERLWVVDLGASAVEVALVEADPALVDLRGARAVDGPGGRDMDLALTDALCAQCARTTGADPRTDPAAVELLRREAEWARTRLGATDAVDVNVAALMFREGQSIDLRARLEAAHLGGEIRRLVAGVQSAAGALHAALDLGAEPTPTRLILVGGLARSPAVRAGISAALGLVPEEPEDGQAPLLAAVRGAARVAAGATASVVDGTPLPLRVGRADPAIVIPGGMPLPLTMGCAMEGGPTPVRIWHGVQSDPDHLVGELSVEQPARVELRLDPDGVLEVDVEPLPGARLDGGATTGAPQAIRPRTSRRPAPVRPVRRSRGPGRGDGRPQGRRRDDGPEKQKPPMAGPSGVGAKGGSRTPTS